MFESGAGRAPRDCVCLMELEPDIQLKAVLSSVSAAFARLDLGAERLSPAELRALCRAKLARWPGNPRALAGIVAGLDDDGTAVRTPEGAHVSLRHGSVELADDSPTR